MWAGSAEKKCRKFSLSLSKTQLENQKRIENFPVGLKKTLSFWANLGIWLTEPNVSHSHSHSSRPPPEVQDSKSPFSNPSLSSSHCRRLSIERLPPSVCVNHCSLKQQNFEPYHSPFSNRSCCHHRSVDPLSPSIRRARSPFVHVATALKPPTPALFFRELSVHPLLSSSSRRHLHLLAIVRSASSVNQGSVGVIFEDCDYVDYLMAIVALFFTEYLLDLRFSETPFRRSLKSPLVRLILSVIHAYLSSPTRRREKSLTSRKLDGNACLRTVPMFQTAAGL
ncbi:hypothetical protein Ahy_B10g101496 isoform C [Arachis hypogaea]|uniref:Uncharacterized protein n=1 Tax=Arachis hypogaea TaxID=3818 RepID=A0A444WZW7_ARAHY|nr:hypothetical protein Ahy_B10g101496 isoform C [Arachis hypogaea]